MDVTFNLPKVLFRRAAGHSFVVFLTVIWINKIYYSMSSKEMDNLFRNYSYLALAGSAEPSEFS